MVVKPHNERSVVLLFILGFLSGCLASYLSWRRLPNPQPHKEIRTMHRGKKVDGIWTVTDERPRVVPYDGSRPRVRKALILERSRKGFLD
jgi:hypothetical protein